LSLITLENVLTIHDYNDLGLLARNRLIVLAEAQATWSPNIIFRLADYYFDSAMKYLITKNVDLYSSTKMDVPDVEAYVIYTGKRKIECDELSLNELFFDGKKGKPEFKAKIIHGAYKGGIIEEYMGFCRIWDQNVVKATSADDKRSAIVKTVELCIEKGYMAEYFREHRSEVEKIMLTMLTPEYVQLAAERTMKIKASIEALRFTGTPEDQIKDAIIKLYDLTPRYAQNFLDDDTKPEECRPRAL